jgi:hypothetical protein
LLQPSHWYRARFGMFVLEWFGSHGSIRLSLLSVLPFSNEM